VAHGASGDCGGGNNAVRGGWGTVARSGWRCCPVFLSSSLSPLCFSFSSLFLLSLFSFSFRFFLFVSLFFFFLPSSLSFFFSSPVFIGKNKGESGLGGHCATAPPTHGKLWASRHLFKRGSRCKQRKKNLLLPLLRASRGRRRPTVPSKQLHFGLLFFYEQCMKGCRFGQNTSFHLKGKGGKKHVRVHIGPQFVIYSIES